MIICSALCLGLIVPAVFVAEAVLKDPVGGSLGALIFGAWVLVGMPLLWLRCYRWLEEQGERWRRSRCELGSQEGR